MSTLQEQMPELRDLIKKNNFIRLKALLRHNQKIVRISNFLLDDLTEKELQFGLEWLACKEQLNEIDDVLEEAEKNSPVYSKTGLNKLKKAQLVELILCEQPQVELETAPEQYVDVGQCQSLITNVSFVMKNSTIYYGSMMTWLFVVVVKR